MKIYNFYNVNIQLPRFFTFFCLVVLTSCMSFEKSSTPKEYMVDTFFKKLDSGEIYLGMPLDDFMSVVNIRQNTDREYVGDFSVWENFHMTDLQNLSVGDYVNTIMHRSLKQKDLHFSKYKSSGTNGYDISVDTSFFQLNGDWILGDAQYQEREDNYDREPVKIFNKHAPDIFLINTLLEFESLLISKYGYGTEEQKVLLNKLLNKEITTKQFHMEHSRLGMLYTKKNIKPLLIKRSLKPKNTITTPSPSRSQSPSKSISSELSYEDAKKQTIKRFMNKEITRDECLKLLMDLKVQYGK